MNLTELNALWNKILGLFPTKTQVTTALSYKQGTLTAGSGINIQNDVVSLSDMIDCGDY